MPDQSAPDENHDNEESFTERVNQVTDRERAVLDGLARPLCCRCF